jgi:hypothetical protein
MTFAVNIAQGGSNNVTFRNRIINGAMVIDQRNAGASVAFTSAAYTLDRWVGAVGTATGTTIQRSTTSTTGFSNSALITIGTGASPAAGAVNRIYQVIEGFNIADFAWGTASAATVTLSFWVRSSVTGTFSGALYGASTIQSYPFNYTINAANTFEQKTITIAGPTTGTWDSTNGTGIYVNFDLGSGTNFKTTANAWGTGTYIGVTGATNLCATTGATFYITGVQLEAGTTASPFEYRQYGIELQLCQRYYEQYNFGNRTSMFGAAQSASTAEILFRYMVTKRASPTISVNNYLAYRINNWGGGDQQANSFTANESDSIQARFQFNKATANLSNASVIYMNSQNIGTDPTLYISAEL